MPKAPAGLYPGGKERVLRGQNPAQSRPASGRYFLGAAVVGLWGGPTSIHLPLATLAHGSVGCKVSHLQGPPRGGMSEALMGKGWRGSRALQSQAPSEGAASCLLQPPAGHTWLDRPVLQQKLEIQLQVKSLFLKGGNQFNS